MEDLDVQARKDAQVCKEAHPRSGNVRQHSRQSWSPGREDSVFD
jgi:hypothetical protein